MLPRDKHPSLFQKIVSFREKRLKPWALLSAKSDHKVERKEFKVKSKIQNPVAKISICNPKFNPVNETLIRNPKIGLNFKL